jgi:hypothetical protein
MGVVDMTENNDSQPQTNFQYKELHRQKYAPSPTQMMKLQHIFTFYFTFIYDL